MKTQKLLSLDYEIVAKLQEEKNASALVNDLLIFHYRTKKIKTKEELIKEIEKVKKIEALQEQIKAVQNG